MTMAFAWDYLVDRAAHPIVAAHLADLERLDGPEALTHANRVATGAGQCAVAMCLSSQEIEEAILTGLLHEIGRSVLLNLPVGVTRTVSERAIFLAGERLLSPLPQMTPVARAIGALSQPWETMPQATSIASVIDTYDSLCHPRPGKGVRSTASPTDWLLAGSGDHYHPDIVRLWLELIKSETDHQATPDDRSGAA